MNLSAVAAITSLVIALGAVVGSFLTYRATRNRDSAVARLDRGKLELDERREDAAREQRMQQRVDQLVEESFGRLRDELDAERSNRQRLAARVDQLTDAMRAAGVPVPAELPWPARATPIVAGGST